MFWRSKQLGSEKYFAPLYQNMRPPVYMVIDKCKRTAVKWPFYWKLAKSWYFLCREVYRLTNILSLYFFIMKKCRILKTIHKRNDCKLTKRKKTRGFQQPGGFICFCFFFIHLNDHFISLFRVTVKCLKTLSRLWNEHFVCVLCPYLARFRLHANVHVGCGHRENIATKR